MEDIIFKSIQKEGVGLYKEKGSKFFGYTFSVKDEETVKSILKKLWDDNNGACHVCYAFRLGADKKLYRSNDDGEPNNSAGPPILAQIEKYELTNVLIAVVRFYGGTNLGVGGLINAYRTAAEDAIHNSTIVETCEKAYLTLHFGYEQMSTVMHTIKVNNLSPTDQQFETTCEIKFSIPHSQLVQLQSLFERMDGVEIITS